MTAERGARIQRGLDNPMPRELRRHIAAYIEPQTMNAGIDHGEVMDCIEMVYPEIVLAERRRFADELDQLRSSLFASFVDEFPGYSYHSATMATIQGLRVRAAELRGEEK